MFRKSLTYGPIPLTQDNDTHRLWTADNANYINRLMRIHEIAAAASSARGNDKRISAMADLLTKWIEIDPTYTPSFRARKKSITARLLGFEDMAARCRAVGEPMLYRGYCLRGQERRQLYSPSGLHVVPRDSYLLESWTTDQSWAYEHAGQFRDGIVLVQPTAKLDVFFDISTFSKMFESELGVEAEVLVRPHPLLFKADNIFELED